MGKHAAEITETSLLGGIGYLSYKSREGDENSRIKSLQMRMREIKDSTNQQSIDNMAKLNSTLATSAAVQAAQGGGSAGKMLSISDINNFSRDENADKLSEIFQEKPLLYQEDEAERQKNSLLPVVGDLTKAASIAASLASL